ncbi:MULTISPECIES: hypothetical protein [Rhizobium/Agrobacterium group]|uniref:hypothetical protein n=1 Tax=Rhizobium/Agrobacterium group TaxID=227290 RepID=UPI000858F68F|nr:MULTISPECIES: hypothetical protein [unclassified Agrobacterium]AOG10631.1 hypothetical protein BSY240_3806 [Agrobacterium sp. RAC06]MDM7981982.1 hypothetical protein [Rhizobium sp.]MDM8012568.1 hypothetical protein [Rhizobium sp.]
MNSMAALMVIVACHPQDTTCLQDPVAVISYDTDEACYGALPKELKRARAMAEIIYGDCFPVSADLVAGRNIRQTIDPNKLAVLGAPVSTAGPAEAQALVPPVPAERYGE